MLTAVALQAVELNPNIPANIVSAAASLAGTAQRAAASHSQAAAPAPASALPPALSLAEAAQWLCQLMQLLQLHFLADPAGAEPELASDVDGILSDMLLHRPGAAEGEISAGCLLQMASALPAEATMLDCH